MALFGLGLASVLVFILGRRMPDATFDATGAAVSCSLSAISLILVAAFRFAQQAPTDIQAALLASAAVVGESVVYLPLGNEQAALALRIGICLLIVLAAALASRHAAMPGRHHRRSRGQRAYRIVIWPDTGTSGPRRDRPGAIVHGVAASGGGP